ncbi:glycosyltransferase family 2 protein [Geodermatophilus sp. SYSU D00700]
MRPTQPPPCLVSVVMPFKNAERFMRESVNSVLAQTWTALELVLIDDGGGDSSHRIAAEFARADPNRIRLVRHRDRANRGIGPSRALGIRSAHGEVIAFLDADDVWEPRHVEDQLRLLMAHPEADMVCGRVWAWHSWADATHEDQLSKLAFAPGAVVAGPRLLAAVLRDGGVATTPCALLVRREAVRDCVDHLEDFPGMYEDQVLNSALQLCRSAVMSGGTTAWYRQHAGSYSARVARSPEAHDGGRLAFLTWLRRHVDEFGEIDAEIDALLERALREARRHTVGTGGIGRPDRAAAHRVLPARVRYLLRAVRRRMPDIAGVRMERAVYEQRLSSALFRHGSDIRGDVLTIGSHVVTPDVGSTGSLTALPWGAIDESAGPHHLFAGLESTAYNCIVAAPGTTDPGLGRMGLAHLRRALRPGGILLLVLPLQAVRIEHALREVFGSDTTRIEHQAEPGPQHRPLVLLRGVIPVP